MNFFLMWFFIYIATTIIEEYFLANGNGVVFALILTAKILFILAGLIAASNYKKRL